MSSPSQRMRPRWYLVLSASGVLVSVALFASLGSGAVGGERAEFLGRFHPLLVHLPIGVLVLVCAAELGSFWSGWRSRLDPVLAPALIFLLGSGVAALTAGLLLAQGGGYPAQLLTLHGRLAVAAVSLVSLSLAAWGLHREHGSPRWRHVFRGILLLSAIALGAGAHQGGSMTHGESFLVKHAPGWVKTLLGDAASVPPAKQSETKARSVDPVLYDDVLQPLLRKYCLECHGPDKAKGALRVDSYQALLEGGEYGPAVVPGRPDKSLMVMALKLPRGNDDRMPPEGKPGPSSAEIELISWWVARGASTKERVRDLLPPAQVLELLKTRAGQLPASAGDPEPEPDADEPTPGAASPKVAAVASDVPAPPAPAVALSAGTSGLVYEDLVAPLLVARCGSCHGAHKQKGRLRVDSIAALLRGGKGGPALVAGSAAASLLIERISLPSEHDEHMPPSDEPQLTPEQVRLLSSWIDDGARAGGARSELPPALAGTQTPAPPIRELEAAPESEEAVEVAAAAQHEPGALASPAGSEGFSVSQAELERLPLSIALFEDVIQPMLRAECGECHLGEPLMGGLSVASHADLIQSGTLLPGEPDQSELLRRVLLPASDDDRMPPEGMQPLDAAETFALRYWIEQGAMAPDPRARSSLPAGVARAAIARLTPASVPGSTPGPVVRTEAAAERAARADGGGCAACSGTRSKAASMPAIGVLAVGGGLWGRRRTRLLRVQQGRRAT